MKWMDLILVGITLTVFFITHNTVLFWIMLIGTCAYCLYTRIKTNNEAIERGEIIKRDIKYFTQRHKFFTSISDINILWNSVDKSVLKKYGVKVAFGENKIYFKVGDTTALLSMYLEENKKIYEFRVIEYKSSKYGVSGFMETNVILTDIEKTILRLDPEAKIERLHNPMKTKLF